MATVLRAVGLMVSLAGITAWAAAPAAFKALEQRAGGRLGVCALDTGTRRSFAYHDEARFPLCSTFKVLLVGRVLQKVDAGQERLARILPYGPGDLLAHAPVTAQQVGHKGMNVEALCAATLVYSDNTAANLLLATLGGPKAITDFARALGDRSTHLDRIEPDLNTPAPGQDLDSSTPSAMVALLEKIALGPVLAPPSRAMLVSWLLGNTTGDACLKAGLPSSWRVGDKTGGGANGATHDLAICFPPGRAPILVAVYYTGSQAPTGERKKVLAEVGRLVAAEFQ